MKAGPPAVAAVPAAVRALAGDQPVRPVWRNELGGLTFALGHQADRYLKWTPAASGIDLGREAARLRWAAPYLPVPELLDSGSDESGSWLITGALAGRNAVEPRWLAAPAIAARALGSGLRALHDALPVERCPFSWAAEDRIAAVMRRAERGLLDPAEWHDEHAGQPVPRSLARLADPPPAEKLVVCHGDPCAPNTLLDDSGRVAGFVDLGSLGVADRWADLAVGSWSLGWNYGPGYEASYFQAYGVDPDSERIDYYRLLWDLAE
ncbi:MAG: kanamycin kinase [Pseudonocardiales bacterium]|nr:kanamycin kinase [Pseudonocardiales bacterium]